MAAAQKQQEKEPVNIIHQNAIFCETIMKEQRHQKLYTSFGFNPYKKCKNHARLLTSLPHPSIHVHIFIDYVLAGKPNSKHDSADGTEDGRTHFVVKLVDLYLIPRGGHYHRSRVTICDRDQDEIKRSNRSPGENQAIKVTGGCPITDQGPGPHKPHPSTSTASAALDCMLDLVPRLSRKL